MDEVLKALISQAFASQSERIDNLKKEVEALVEDKAKLEKQIADMKELDELFDRSITELKDYIRNYVSGADESNLMEEYKFGEQEK